MIEQLIAKRLRKPVKPLSQQTIATIRIAYDAIVLILALGSIFRAGNASGDVMGIDAMVLYSVVSALILAGSVSAFLLYRREKPSLATNVLIYSLVIGTFINSIFIERVGSFGLIATVSFTIFTVSSGVEFKKGVTPIVVTILVGITGLAFDTLFEGASFRFQPTLGMSSIWWPAAVFAVVIIFILARQFHIFSLRAKLISSFVVITLISLVILILFVMISFMGVLTDEANEALFSAASQTSHSISDYLNTNISSIQTEASFPALVSFMTNSQGDQPHEVQEVLEILANKDANILSYGLVDLEGQVVADSTPQHVGRSEADLNYFAETLAGNNAVVSDVIFDPWTDIPSIFIGTPISENGNTVGLLRLQIDANVLQDLLVRSKDIVGKDSFAVLFDENFIHLAHGSDPSTLFTAVAPLDAEVFSQLKAERRLPDLGEEEIFLNLGDLEANLLEAQASDQDTVFFRATDIATGERENQVAVVGVENTPWLLAFFQPRDIFLQPLSRLGDTSIFLLVISGVLATAVGLALTQVIVRPIIRLNETASKISEGDFSSRVEIISQDEIGTLGNTFNMMSLQLQNLVGNLENQVAERTRELANQTAQLKATAEIARDATTEEKVTDLLDRASFLMCDRFGFYHVGIYLIDSRGQYAVLSSSGDPQGKQLVQNEHKYRINTESNVGIVCAVGKPRTASISDPETEINPHPLLPSTRSQLTLPLRASGKTIGAIDIQSTNPRGFTSEEVDIFNTFSDQIATAIQKAEYRGEIQETLNELETAYGQFTQEAWRRFIQGAREKYAGYRYQQLNVEPVEKHPEEVVRAWDQGEIITEHVRGDGTSKMAIPMKVRGEVIGVLDIEFDGEHVPPDTQNLMTEIADRLSLVLENARLIETAQTQVEREQLASYLTNKIRQSLDLDTVLRTATKEIGETLGLAEVEVRLGTVDTDLQLSGNGSFQDNGSPQKSQNQDYPDMNEDSNEYNS